MLRYIATIKSVNHRLIKIYKTESPYTPLIGVSAVDSHRILLYRYSTEQVKERFDEIISKKGDFWVDTGRCQTESKNYLGFLVRTYF